MAIYVREALMILAANDNPDIRVVITSDGGNVTVGLAIYDILKNYLGKKIGVVNSFCRSMAVVILQACDERIASPNSRIKIHNVLVNIEHLPAQILFNRHKISEFVEQVVADVKNDQRTIEEIYRARTGQTLKTIRRLNRQDYDLTAKEALKFGLIDRII